MADKSSKKGLKLNIAAENIMYTNVSKSKNYNNASVGIKLGENEYMSINYEWSSETIPDFVMDLFGFMKANKEVIEASVKEKASEYEEFSKLK